MDRRNRTKSSAPRMFRDSRTSTAVVTRLFVDLKVALGQRPTYVSLQRSSGLGLLRKLMSPPAPTCFTWRVGRLAGVSMSPYPSKADVGA